MEKPEGRIAAFIRELRSLDETITRPLQIPEDRKVLRALALTVAHSGDAVVLAVLLVCAWLAGGPQWKARVIMIVAGLLAAEVLTVIIKMSVRRQRPPGTSGAIYRRTDPYSFPSGHAARASMLSILFWITGPFTAFIAIVVWSPIMVLSRIAIGIHYVFDVAVGLILGTALSFIVVQVVSLIVARIYG
jgi:membrane-associated phospholipid phosphatase